MSANRQHEIARMVAQLRVMAEQDIADGHARAHAKRALADALENREASRLDAEQTPPTDFSPGGICGGF